MIRIALVAALLVAPALAQDSPPVAVPPATTAAAPVVAVGHRTVDVVLDTTAGPIRIALEVERAPVTSANFLRYVDQKRLDGTGFYRAMKLRDQPLLGLVQGGVKGDAKRSLPPVAHEPTSKTGLKHIDGTISLARAAPGSGTADFFIIIGDFPSLDADPQAPGDNQGFAAFGRVTEGMETVAAILKAPTSPTAGVGVMKGQMLEPAIIINSARRARP